jgi:hypothetical protein
MKRLVPMLFFVMACGGPQAKQESPIVQGATVPAGCCCKTVPDADEKEIVPVYAMKGRMECSTDNGQCVDDVQCNGAGSAAGQTASGPTDTGVPPPPDLPSGSSGSSDTGVPPPPDLPASGS